MTPKDISIFQIMFGIFTLTFVVLVYYILQFMQAMMEARNKVIDLAVTVEQGIEPIFEDLRAGAAHFRATGEATRYAAGQVAELSDSLVKMTSFTKGAKGIWSMLAQAAGSFLKK